MPDWRVIQGGVLACLGEMPDESVHCVVTSPPYWGLRDYGVEGQVGLEPTPDLYVEHMVEVFREVRRVLRKDGTLWLNMGDCYAANRSYQVPDSAFRDVGNNGASNVPAGLKPKDLVGMPWRLAFALQADGWWLRCDIIWSKPNPMPESVRDRPTRAHEYVFLMTKAARYYYDAEAVRERGTSGPSDIKKMAEGKQRIGGKHKDLDDHLSKASKYTNIGHKRGVGSPMRNKRSVWEIATQPYPGAHFATFPEKLVEPCVRAGTAEGGTVLDPFCGSGTTGAVALRLGRSFVGIELNAEYCKLARKRIGEAAPLFAKEVP